MYLLWFNEWEANHVLGIFETYKEAERWKNYFIANPLPEDDFYTQMAFYAGKMKKFKKANDYETRFEIEEWTLGQLNSHIKLDNLKLLEWEAQKNEKTNA